jgi:hypothetical protein
MLRYETDLDALSDYLVGIVREEAASPRLFVAAVRHHMPKPSDEG